MNHIFIGMIFLLLDFNLTLDSWNVIGLLPDFIGIYILWKGVENLQTESSSFRKLISSIPFFLIYFIVYWFANAIGLFESLSFSGQDLLSLAFTLLSEGMILYTTYIVICGITELEQNHQLYLNSEFMRKLCLLLIPVSALICIPIFPILSLISFFVSFIIRIILLIQLHNCKKVMSHI